MELLVLVGALLCLLAGDTLGATNDLRGLVEGLKVQGARGDRLSHQSKDLIAAIKQTDAVRQSVGLKPFDIPPVLQALQKPGSALVAENLHNLIPKPPQNTLAKPIDELVKPPTELVKPTVDILKPAGELLKPSIELFKPSIEILKPVGEVVKPIIDHVKPSGEVAKPIINHVDQVKPTGEVDKPIVDQVKPTGEVDKPIVDQVKPTGEVDKPITDPVKRTGEVAKPIIDQIKPTGEVDKPIIDKVKPNSPLPQPPSIPLKENLIGLVKPEIVTLLSEVKPATLILSELIFLVKDNKDVKTKRKNKKNKIKNANKNKNQIPNLNAPQDVLDKPLEAGNSLPVLPVKKTGPKVPAKPLVTGEDSVPNVPLAPVKKPAVDPENQFPQFPKKPKKPIRKPPTKVESEDYSDEEQAKPMNLAFLKPAIPVPVMFKPDKYGDY